MGLCGVGGKAVQRKLVLLGDGACGTTRHEPYWVATTTMAC